MKSNFTHSKIKEAIKSTLDVSSIHSFPNISRNKYKSLKALWAIFLMISLSGCSYLIYDQVLDYLQFDVVSSIDRINRKPIKFPVVTICNQNFFDTEYANTNKLLKDIFNMSEEAFAQNDSIRVKFGLAQYTAISYARFLNDTIRNKLQYSLHQTVISCVFKKIDCSLSDDFNQYLDPFYGICLQFNSNFSKNIVSTGSKSGLQLELIANDASVERIYSITSGFNLFIGTRSYFNSADKTDIVIPLGKVANIELMMNSFKKQPKPYSNCVANLNSLNAYSSKIYKQTLLLNNNTYTRNFCLNTCFQNICGEKCGCYDLTAGPFPSNLRPCLNDTDQICDNNYWNAFLNGNDCDCPFECEITSFDYKTTFLEYPTRSYATDFLLNNGVVKSRFSNRDNLTYEHIKDSVVAINIYYNEMIETKFSEKIKTTFSDLGSNIGGILSLFIGISFLSFVEFIEIFLEIFYIILERKKILK